MIISLGNSIFVLLVDKFVAATKSAAKLLDLCEFDMEYCTLSSHRFADSQGKNRLGIDTNSKKQTNNNKTSDFIFPFVVVVYE